MYFVSYRLSSSSPSETLEKPLRGHVIRGVGRLIVGIGVGNVAAWGNPCVPFNCQRS